MITGAKNPANAKIIGKQIAQIFAELGHPDEDGKIIKPNPYIKFKKFKVENMIATVDLGFPVRLESVAYHHRAEAR